MNRCRQLIIYFIAMSVAVSAYSQETSTNDWHPNTTILDLGAKLKDHDQFIGDARTTLAHDVKKFYQLLRDKQWHKTYELRAKAFREDVPEADYLAEAKQNEKLWGLVNYDVLSVHFENSYGSTNADEAILICKFIELPGYETTYSAVFWHKEDGVWKCLSAGPSKLRIFYGTRPPVIDWR